VNIYWKVKGKPEWANEEFIAHRTDPFTSKAKLVAEILRIQDEKRPLHSYSFAELEAMPKEKLAKFPLPRGTSGDAQRRHLIEKARDTDVDFKEEMEAFKAYEKKHPELTPNRAPDAVGYKEPLMKWYLYLRTRTYPGERAKVGYEPWSHAPPEIQKAHGLKGGEMSGNPDPKIIATVPGPALVITKGPTQPTLPDYFAIKNMAHIIGAIIQSRRYGPKEEWLQQLLIATRLVDEGLLHPKGTPAPTTIYKKNGPESVEGHQEFAIEQYNKGEKAIVKQYEKSGLKKEIDTKSNAWIAKQPLKPDGNRATVGDWVDKVLLPDIRSNQEERQLGKKAWQFLASDIKP
jgi:hypothetical protein